MRSVFRSLLAAIFGLALILPQARSASAAGPTVLKPSVKINMPGLPLNLANPRGTGLSTDFIRYDPVTRLIYLTDGANKSVDVFNSVGQQMVGRITVPDSPHDAITDDNLGVLMVPLSNKNVAIINLQTLAESDVTVGGASIADLAGYDPATHILVVGSKGTPPQLSFIHVDPAGSTLLGQFQTVSPEEPRFFNGKYYVSAPNQILVVDATTRSIVQTLSVPGCSGHGYAQGPGSEFYLGCTAGGVIVNLATLSIVAHFDPSAISDTDQPTYDAKNNRYYAPGHITRNGASVAVMAVIDASTHQLLNTFDIDPGSETQAAADANGVVYVATAPALGGECLSICLFGYEPSAPAGKDFTVTSSGAGSVSLSWTGGLGDSSLRINRFTASGTSLVASPAVLSTSATDTLPAGTNLACYQLQALGATSAVIAQSDIECVVTNIASPSPLTAPMPISIVLHQGSVATVSWGAAPGVTSYLFAELRSGRVQVLTPGQLTATDALSGADCYVVIGRGSTTSMSDGVCAIGGAATVATDSRSSRH